MTDRHRSAITGEYVTADHAELNPDTTVSEARDHQPEPSVRTVGDLTARHIGRRVRLEGVEVVEGELVRIEFRPSRVAMTVVKPDGSRKYPRTGIDSPCEVLS